MQIEGREYIVQGNDMMYVRFNVLSCIYKKKTIHYTAQVAAYAIFIA